MRKLVLTCAIGEEYQKVAEVTNPSKKAYADRIGADFLMIDANATTASPAWAKLAMYDLLGREYDRVIFLDADTLVRPDCPDLFEMVPEKGCAMFSEGEFLPREQEMREGASIWSGGKLAWDQKYYNTGVIVASRAHRQIFRLPENTQDHYYEQTYVNIRIQQTRVPMYSLRYEYNYMGSLIERTGLPMEAAYIPHMAGLPVAMMCQTAKDILKSWEEKAPDYKYQRRVWVDVSGGLGDVIDAEPVVRFLLQKVYPDDDCKITTPWPRVFAHFADVQYGEANPWGDNVGAFRCESKPPDGHGYWQYWTHVTSNATDFASVAMLHRQLPIVERRIHLEILPEDVAEVDHLCDGFDLTKAVIVHAGRSWASRTFPLEWWQAVIDGLRAKGHSVCLIGSQGEIHGWLLCEAREGMLDLRDRTSMGAYFEVIRRGKLLVSNDSSPVHVAGAWDNGIILIPSARHPDLVLPCRHGFPYWQATALYRRLTIEDISTQPSEFYGTHADGQPSQPWEVYLPTPQEVIDCADSYMHGEELKWREPLPPYEPKRKRT